MKTKFMKRVYLIFLTVFIVLSSVLSQTDEETTMEFSLDEAISYALENSYQSQNASLEVLRTQKQVWEATAIGLPQISASADYNYNIQNPASPFPAEIIPEDMRPPGIGPGDKILLAFGTKQTMGGAISASQKIFDGAYIIGLQSARTIAKITELAQQKTDVLVAEAVSLAYVSVLVGDETIEILQRNIQNVETSINQISAMYENGLVEEQDVEQLELNLSSLKNSLDRSIRMSGINEEMLKFSMGLDIGKEIRLSDEIEKVLLSRYQLSALGEALELEDHIDFQISENKLKTSDLLVKYEKSKYMPNLSAFFNAGYNSYSEIFDFFEFKDEQWAPIAIVGLQLKIPVFSSFQRKARVDIAKIDQKKALLEHDEMVQRLFMNLRIAQDGYAYSLDNYNTAQNSLKLAGNIERKENIKYKEGISTSLDLTTAQNQLYAQQEKYLNAILAVIQSKVSLDKALDKF